MHALTKALIATSLEYLSLTVKKPVRGPYIWNQHRHAHPGPPIEITGAFVEDGVESIKLNNGQHTVEIIYPITNPHAFTINEDFVDGMTYNMTDMTIIRALLNAVHGIEQVEQSFVEEGV